MFPADPVVLVRCTVYYSRLVCMLHTLNKNQPTVGNRKQLTEYAAVQEHLKWEKPTHTKNIYSTLSVIPVNIYLETFQR